MTTPPNPDRTLTRRLAVADGAASRQTEHSIQKTRTWCVVFALLQTATYHGDGWWLSWTAVAVLIATAAWVQRALRTEVDGGRLPMLGGVTMTGHGGRERHQGSASSLAAIGWVGMAGDTIVCVLVLANSLADPNAPVQLLPLILVAEAAARWGWAGGLAGGLGSGLMGSAWAAAIHRRHHLDLPVGFATFRVAIMIMVGAVMGNIVRQARQQRRAADAVFNASRDLVATFGLDGSLQSVNPACETILGYSPEELLGRDRSFLLDIDDRPFGPPDAGLYEREGAQLVELRFVHKDGHLVWIEMDLLPDLRAGVVYAIGRDVSSRRRAEAELRHRVDHDTLTGVWNRDSLLSHLTRMLGRGHRPGLVFVDLDDFKQVNDRHGHIAGDRVLAAMAERLCVATGLDGAVARYAGDEFCIVVDDPDDLDEVAARVRQVLDEPFDIGAHELMVTATLGLSVGAPGDSPELLVHRADQAMYRGKADRPA